MVTAFTSKSADVTTDADGDSVAPSRTQSTVHIRLTTSLGDDDPDASPPARRVGPDDDGTTGATPAGTALDTPAPPKQSIVRGRAGGGSTYRGFDLEEDDFC